MTSAKIIAASSHNWVYENAKIVTLQLEYPRYILPQLNDYRNLGTRSTQSTRAVSIARQIANARNKMFVPTVLFKPAKGMQGRELAEVDSDIFRRHALKTIDFVEQLAAQKIIHKQHLGRYLEPFQYVKTVLTAQDFTNFFRQRLPILPDFILSKIETSMDIVGAHYSLCTEIGGADIEMQLLAVKIWQALQICEYKNVKVGDFHLPYIRKTEMHLTISELGYISAARCARASYDGIGHNRDLADDLRLGKQLLEQNHTRPFEHIVEPWARHSGVYKGWISINFR